MGRARAAAGSRQQRRQRWRCHCQQQRRQAGQSKGRCAGHAAAAAPRAVGPHRAALGLLLRRRRQLPGVCLRGLLLPPVVPGQRAPARDRAGERQQPGGRCQVARNSRLSGLRNLCPVRVPPLLLTAPPCPPPAALASGTVDYPRPPKLMLCMLLALLRCCRGTGGGASGTAPCWSGSPPGRLRGAGQVAQ